VRRVNNITSGLVKDDFFGLFDKRPDNNTTAPCLSPNRITLPGKASDLRACSEEVRMAAAHMAKEIELTDRKKKVSEVVKSLQEKGFSAVEAVGNLVKFRVLAQSPTGQPVLVLVITDVTWLVTERERFFPSGTGGPRRHLLQPRALAANS